MRVLLTGGYGCIGSWIVRNLLGRGDQVWIYDLKEDASRLRLIMDDAQVRQVTVAVATPSYVNDIQAIWNASCTVSCHKGASPDGQLSLETGSSYAALVNVAMVATCSDGTRVSAVMMSSTTPSAK